MVDVMKKKVNIPDSGQNIHPNQRFDYVQPQQLRILQAGFTTCLGYLFA
jgi:hypothetical protein